ncbi:MAG: ABC transporter permease [Bacteroidia bacterium]|jgi:lipopolysaccharide transport system permease protein|nr:MAG: ABC transporter permease [Bacteroidia bacterium]
MQQENWSNIISSKAVFSWTTLNDVWHYRDLLWMFVRRDIVTNYKQTVLGPLWFFIQPALTTAMFVFIQRAAKIDTDGIHPVLFYLIGVTAWNYFAECLTKTSTTFKDNAFIFGKVYFPRLILPLSIVVSNLIRFFIQLLLFVIITVLFIALGKTKMNIQITVLFFPLLVLIMAGLGLGAGLIITSMTTKYRDLALLVQFGVQLLMYTTLVIPLSATSGILRKVLEMNPMIPIIDLLRQSLFNTNTPNFALLAYSFTAMVILLIFGIYIFSKTEKTFTDTV